MDPNNINLDLNEKINYLRSAAEYADMRLKQINEKIGSINNLQLHIILQIGMAINHYYKSLIATLETSNIIAANILFRTLIESFINIEYIMQDDTQKRAIAFMLEDFKIQRRNIETIRDLIIVKPSEASLIPKLSTVEECEEQLMKINKEIDDVLYKLKTDYNIDIDNSDLKIPSIENRADAVNLADIYNILYRQLCWITHLNSSGLKGLLQFNDDKNSYVLAPLAIKNEINKIIPVAYDVHLIIMKDLLKKFDLYVQEDFKAMEDISEKLKK